MAKAYTPVRRIFASKKVSGVYYCPRCGLWVMSSMAKAMLNLAQFTDQAGRRLAYVCNNDGIEMKHVITTRRTWIEHSTVNLEWPHGSAFDENINAQLARK